MYEYKYSHQKAVDRCESIGLKWDYGNAIEFDKEAFVAGLTQDQFDAVLWSYTYRMKYYFAPSNYPFLGRVAVAAFFLFDPVKQYFAEVGRNVKARFVAVATKF